MVWAVIGGIASLDRAVPGELSFLASAKYSKLFTDTQATAVLITPELADVESRCGNRVVVAKPHEAILALLPKLYRMPAPPFKGVHPTVIVGEGASIGADVCIEAYTVIEPGAVRTPIWGKGTAQVAAVRQTYPPEALERYRDDLVFFEKVLEANARQGAPADEVVDAVIDALEAERPRTRYVIGRDARARALMRRLLPDRLNDAILQYFLGRMRKRLS